MLRFEKRHEQHAGASPRFLGKASLWSTRSGLEGAGEILFENEGSPTETDLIADALALQRFVAEQHHVKPHRVVICGESIGVAMPTGGFDRSDAFKPC
ncbi:MAG: hypothetical protein O3A00_06865 [Planctomycetota bacterium]|nr:hypothetical protein [Planctomycetota bacterium]